MDKLLLRLRHDFPQFKFVRGPAFSWSAKQQTVIIPRQLPDDTAATWALLHEVGHATLQHRDYTSDLELLKLEAAAWHQALEIGKKYDQPIDTEHIQDCLDSYRDWLHHRSTCPVCGIIAFQKDTRHYRCYNCNASWAVSRSRLCRPYRRLQKEPRKNGVLPVKVEA